MISLLLCTVRDVGGLRDEPEKDPVLDIVEQLAGQNYHDFELVVVDGLHAKREAKVAEAARKVGFRIRHVPPRSTLWTRNKKVAISTYRNTGISWARGELVVNLDDCCALPKNFVELFALAWKKYGIAAAMTWRSGGDNRPLGRVTLAGMVYGYSSFPLEAALGLNGYDEAFDGAQGLEDMDWSTRLFNLRVPQAMVELGGFRLLPQTGHSPEAIDRGEPFVKCCNAAWQTQRVRRSIARANKPEDWTPETLRSLVGPCQFLAPGDRCAHHHGQNPCAFIEHPWVRGLVPLTEAFLKEPPVVNLQQLRRENGL